LIFHWIRQQKTKKKESNWSKKNEQTYYHHQERTILRNTYFLTAISLLCFSFTVINQLKKKIQHSKFLFFVISTSHYFLFLFYSRYYCTRNFTIGYLMILVAEEAKSRLWYLFSPLWIDVIIVYLSLKYITVIIWPCDFYKSYRLFAIWWTS
jgi:hypothetical protein